jgi:hypothetical protein
LYSFYFSRQRKITLRNYMHFQSSAARPQPYDRIWCKAAANFLRTPRPMPLCDKFVSRITAKTATLPGSPL